MARLIALVLAAASLAGCAASSNSDTAFQAIGTPAAGPAAGGMAAPVPAKAAGGGVTTASIATSGAAAKTVDTLTAPGTFGSSGYKIGAQDVLDVSVFKVPDLSKSVQVSEAGTINLPLLGEVAAAGRTAAELERALTSALGTKYLRNPQVTVLVREYNSQRVTLEGGGVKKPGVYPMRGSMSLLQLIATAEGTTEIASTDVAVFRTEGGRRMAARFDLSAIRAGEVEDPSLRPGDVVVTSTSATKETLNTVLKLVPLASVFALL